MAIESLWILLISKLQDDYYKLGFHCCPKSLDTKLNK